MQGQTKIHPCRRSFLLALFTAALIFIPVMIYDKGYFFFLGDFNVQQIPFYKLAHEAVRSGNIGWNWYTDLGVNFIGSYSFYLIGSPFFWLTLPFPNEFVPHLMAPLLILKHACAALTASLYLKRFVRQPEYTIIGSMLYAFSGFAVYNIFFNHFHEAIVFFPLLLVGLEELVVNNRRGLFALTVAINAFVNYWFFIGEVVFVLIYFVIRSLSSDWRMSFTKFFWTGFEAIIGMLLAMCLFLPSVLAIMGNPRTGMDELLNGWSLWLYWHNQLYPAIVSSAFFPPDIPSRPNLFPDRGAKWASLSAWLPFISMAGVLAYIKSKRDWLRRILLVSFVMALVPVLNSAFILFNNSYYARWYYMPVLLMALASALALENHAIDLTFGVRTTALYSLSVIAILGLTPTIYDDGGVKLGLAKYPDVFAAIAAIVMVGLGLLIWVLKRWRDTPKFPRVFSGCMCFIIVAYSLTYLGVGKSNDGEYIRETALKGRYVLEEVLPDSPFARADIYKGMDNQGMFWHLPNIQAFHSIIPVSTMEFYPEVGVKRDVSSKPEVEHHELRSLLSVRWLFVKTSEEKQDLMPGYTYFDTQLGHNIYENDCYIPMGFTYDYSITRKDLERLPEGMRSPVMLRALVLEDEQADGRNRDILEHMPYASYADLTIEDYYHDCDSRKQTAAYSFEIDRKGFTSKIELSRENLVFYSVPYDKGWSATVNGQPVEIEKVNIGFMAVRAPAGDATIRFTYHTPGLRLGLAATGLGVLLLVGYLLLWRRFGTQGPEPPSPYYDQSECDAYEQETPVAEWKLSPIEQPPEPQAEDEQASE